MILNEIRNRIEAKSDIQESKNNSKNKGRQYTRTDRETIAPHNIYDLNET